MNLAFKRIVVATDFSPASDLAIQYAQALAHRYKASIHVIHVVEEPFPITPELYIHEIPDFRERLVTDARRQLEQAIAGIDVSVTSEVLVGTVAGRIVEAATAADADLIVVGTHGRGAIGHLLMGSVAERVVRTAPCPVLTVRDPQGANAAT
jgi:nucleotide-binding universal stress UspA family protein